MALVVIVGLAIGGWLAVSTRNQSQPVRTVARSNAAPVPVRTVAARKAPVAAAATAAPTAVPAVPATVAPATTVTAEAAVQGAWQIDEANVQVGTIVWSGNAVLSRGNTIALDVRKVSVGGRAAAPCERETALHAAFSVGVPAQTVPYREVNCEGVSSTGEVRVSSFSSDGRSFRGSFWLDGAKLGDFEARRR